MSSSPVLNCYRCEKTATVFVPDNSRVLCDIHFATFKEAYGSINFATVEINDNNVEAIFELTPKQSTTVDQLPTVVQDEHRTPIQLITDHLGELATGVEPATCKVCRKPMQLHAQFATTKQTEVKVVKSSVNKLAESTTLSDEELQEAIHPNFLDNFDDEGRGVCKKCKNEYGNASGLQVIDKPSDIKTILQHLNDNKSGSGHYNQLMDYSSRFRDLDVNAATNGNLPFYVTRYKDFAANPNYDASRESEFPFSLPGSYEQFDFRGNPLQLAHTLFHAIGMLDSTLGTDHGHIRAATQEELAQVANMPPAEALKKVQSPFCSTCRGHGQHPLRGQEEFEDYLEAMQARAAEISRDDVRRRVPSTSFDPLVDAGAIDLRSQSSIVTGHAGPNIKPHDHHNKPHNYKKRQQPGQISQPSSGSSQIKVKTPGSGGGNSQYKLVYKKGPGSGKGMGKGNIFSRFPVEKWIYNTMNAVHDMTHTVYENPSYMYRNPNPMYYSVPRSQWGMAKPWRN